MYSARMLYLMLCHSSMSVLYRACSSAALFLCASTRRACIISSSLVSATRGGGSKGGGSVGFSGNKKSAKLMVISCSVTVDIFRNDGGLLAVYGEEVAMF